MTPFTALPPNRSTVGKALADKVNEYMYMNGGVINLQHALVMV